MQIKVKRDRFKGFEKAVIEIDNVQEWTMISVGLMKQMEYWNESLDRWSNPEYIRNFAEEVVAEYRDDAKKYYESYKAAYEALETKNEIPLTEPPLHKQRKNIPNTQQ